MSGGLIGMDEHDMDRLIAERGSTCGVWVRGGQCVEPRRKPHRHRNEQDAEVERLRTLLKAWADNCLNEDCTLCHDTREALG